MIKIILEDGLTLEVPIGRPRWNNEVWEIEPDEKLYLTNAGLDQLHMCLTMLRHQACVKQIPAVVKAPPSGEPKSAGR